MGGATSLYSLVFLSVLPFKNTSLDKLLDVEYLDQKLCTLSFYYITPVFHPKFTLLAQNIWICLFFHTFAKFSISNLFFCHSPHLSLTLWPLWLPHSREHIKLFHAWRTLHILIPLPGMPFPATSLLGQLLLNSSVSGLSLAKLGPPHPHLTLLQSWFLPPLS